ncbi:MAG TPA: beta-N-acetylhexosaminidase [Casimicrobiaceae bacterium]
MSFFEMPLGPVMLGVEGTTLSGSDRERLVHPLVGAVILFARNYVSRAQLSALTEQIRSLRGPALVIGVDHEGGRVQRFRDEFASVPPMRALGAAYETHPDGALAQAERWGGVIADELGGCGIDFSFTPVLDLDFGASVVIGDRAFHRDPRAVARLASSLCRGLHRGGMAAIGKHFPGHGNVAADSHVDLPIDRRSYSEIEAADLVPFAALIQEELLEGVMPAHVLYSNVDMQPAGFSGVWLQDVLRSRLGFGGLIFSDDLEMAGARGAGDIVARADAAVAAGCDMVLACNDFAAMDDLLARWKPPVSSELAPRLEPMRRS